MAGELRLTGFQAAVRGPSAADQIFEALYRQVVTLALPPGSRLSEAEVAKAAGVSRQPVRDAFFRLSQLGFLTIRPQRSTEVSVVSEQAVQQARFVRTALEVETIRLAAEGFGPDEIAQLEAVLGEQAAAIDADDRERFHTLDDEFHRRICALCGHDYAWALIREQKAHMDRVRFMSLSFGAPAALADHRQILRALQANDVKRAVAAMRTHLARIEEHLPRIRAEHGEHFPPSRGRGLMDLPLNAFKRALAEGRPQIGLWCTLPGGALAELLAGAGFDWLLFDTEHSPADPITVLEQLQAAAAYPVASVVRAAWNDLVLIKRFLDVGAQSLLLPYVQDAEEARAAVAAIRYPPRGLRGVSTVSRATRFGRVPDYLRRAEAELCLLVQVETAEALARIEAIAAVDGIDGIFIGPSDLAASLGHLGAPGHPEVVAAIEDAMVRIRRAGKPAGILTLDRALARRCLELGALFVAVGLDAALLTQATDALAREFRA